MKLTLMSIAITLALTLTTTLYSQSSKAQFVICPLTVVFEKDSTLNTWGLLTGIPSDWNTLTLLTPQENSKEGWIYGNWFPTDSKATPTSEFFVNVLATRQRLSFVTGEVQFQTYSCVYTLREVQPKKK